MCVDGFGEYVGHSLPDGSHDLYTAPPAPVVPEAEPVAWTDEEELRDVKQYGFGEIFQCPPDKYADSRRVIPLYRELPAQVVPEEISMSSSLPLMSDQLMALGYVKGWNACRAAMLNGAEPVSQTYKLNELSGNSPVTPDGWISCSERMPAQDDWILIYSKHGEYMAGQVQGEYVELSDGTLSWLGNALYWMPLPEPPQEVK
ncbi:DUF551 domain-containing protein [Escherichia marmotae]|uniref:DUF551 domain-containing protein n=1 Tax=Escherichia marmotae TaxID=1499973 RepID=UPI001FD4F909|nr:DUF551 domain-containing protein [Escherichia marmotae]